MRPYGMRPYGMRPYGMRPYGMRPYGMRPYGMRPYGMRPDETRPYGMRPYGMRPDEGPEAAPDAVLDPEEWSADIAELFCSGSALIRLGARLVCNDRSLHVPAIEPPEGVADYLDREGSANLASGLAQALAPSTVKRVGLTQRVLNPMDHQLAVAVGIPNLLTRSLAERPEAAWALKQDIAHALALKADRAFLQGDPASNGPRGLSNTPDVDLIPPGADQLETARAIVASVRENERGARFGCAGWILHPTTLDELTTTLTIDGLSAPTSGARSKSTDSTPRSLDSTPLLVHDGEGGGMLLGYPFVVSTAAEGELADRPPTYFSADWGEAWIGAQRNVVTVDVSTGAKFENDETIVRAIMHHDFAVRRPRCFVYSGVTVGRPDASQRRTSRSKAAGQSPRITRSDGAASRRRAE
jgi:hypothetical protein